VTKRIVTLVSVLIFAALLGLVAGCGGGLPDDAVAQVGDTYISQDDFDARVADFEKQYAGYIPDKASDPDGYKEFTADVLDYMVTYQIVLQKSGDLGISVTDEDVQTELDSILNDTFGGDQSQFDAALEAQNITLDQLRVNFKESLLMHAAYDAVTKDVTTVPDEEVSAYYEAHKADYFVDETRVTRHILIAPGSSNETTASTDAASTTTTAAPTDADWAAALSEAQKVRQELVNGGDWTQLAADYSDDTGTKDSGGDLGAVAKGEMVQEFEDSVFSLAKDEISQPIKTSYGYHIIQVTQINEAKQYTLDEVKEDITSLLLSEKKDQTWTEWMQRAKTEIQIVYKEGMEPVTTTTVAPTETTSGAGNDSTDASETTTTEAGSTITTAAPAPETTTTAAP